MRKVKVARRRLCAVAVAVLAGLSLRSGVNAQEPPKGAEPLPYKNPRLPVDVRVADLLGRMTLEEKAAQLQALWMKQSDITDDKHVFAPEKAKTVLAHGLGQVARPSESANGNGQGPPVTREPREHAEFVNAVQKFLVEQTRLGIPAMFHDEALHGHMAQKGTSFPQPIGLAATFDPETLSQLID